MYRMSWILKCTSLPLAWFFYAQANIPPGTPNWISLIESFGLPIALVIFFVWQWYIDKARMGNRITALEEFQEKVIIKDAEVRQELRDEIHGLREDLKKRPCLHEV